jgi:organic radical activating enzyme
LFFEFLHQKTNKKLSIEFIGGEPTLHPELLSFTKKLSTISFINTIESFTNLSKDLEYYKQLLDANVHLFCSWHSIVNDK